MAIFFFTSCLNVSLSQEQRVFLWFVHVPRVCFLAILDKAPFYWQPKRTEGHLLGLPRSDEGGEDPAKGTQPGEEFGIFFKPKLVGFVAVSSNQTHLTVPAHVYRCAPVHTDACLVT